MNTPSPNAVPQSQQNSRNIRHSEKDVNKMHTNRELDEIFEKLKLHDSYSFAGFSVKDAKAKLTQLLIRERLDETRKAYGVALNHSMDVGSTIVEVLYNRISKLEAQLNKLNGGQE